ncbi:hypothetical protein G3O44_004410, partial [Salmonella enterica]|nr:hypothetical protein [Salmonella enterica]
KRPMMFIRRFTDKKLSTYIRTSHCYLWLSVGRIRRLRRHPTLLQPMMALRLSGQQTPYIPRIKKAAFAALK